VVAQRRQEPPAGRTGTAKVYNGRQQARQGRGARGRTWVGAGSRKGEGAGRNAENQWQGGANACGSARKSARGRYVREGNAAVCAVRYVLRGVQAARGGRCTVQQVNRHTAKPCVV